MLNKGLWLAQAQDILIISVRRVIWKHIKLQENILTATTDHMLFGVLSANPDITKGGNLLSVGSGLQLLFFKQGFLLLKSALV